MGLTFSPLNGTPGQRACADFDGGLLAGTEIATAMGWRAVEALSAGDRVLTFDNGMVPLEAIYRQSMGQDDRMPIFGSARPLSVPAGALGNERSFEVMPCSYLMIESDLAEEMFGDPFVILPARALDGVFGIGPSRMSGQRPSLVRLCFERDEIVYLRSGGLIHCARDADMIDEIFASGHVGPTAALTLREARAFVGQMLEEAQRSGASGTAPAMAHAAV
ncbi:Hint domain-containing protein [Wenxinia saemankumensis]|uniref:Hint domain-containing protein n=1 Tax=Wenxinia saemankumensis TaxID=1447782 RepID=A0A1M6CUM1_9RHOB|nr:Hint domain-containing protein [Wenxinia saemankumensis]SHI64541.1 Hint domain-containing protein [Wenxinia saemankumensis]